ncbi:sugar MFS transporter [Hyphomicrobium sp.]|uniref:sugar MFS transporter n=1 Tax=Hyphomicrobium sp. TaxID=82 RepID=UPI000FBA39E1|nr:sugar MFS transporter [Hyphomicrobium sp.]RUP08160.1 MAG: glucose/galactose MFS transporter [Hyphomicrobium sp.]
MSSPKVQAAKDGEATGIATIAILFFIFGFVAWLNGPLISFVKLAFNLDDVNAFLVPMAFYLSYFFLALPASAVLRRTGMKQGMAIGLFVMAIGSVVFGEFTTMRQYSGTLTGLFIMGAGLALLQTASNPYVCILGPHESAARRVALMGICHKFAGVIAPIFFASLVLGDLDAFDADVARAPTHEAREVLLNAFAARVHGPYMLMAALLAMLGLWIARSRLPDLKAAPADADDRASVSGASSIFDFPHLWLGVLCLFLYVGVEVLAGDTIGLYGTGFGLSLEATRFFTSYTLFAMLVGYVAGLLVVPRVVSQQTYLALSAALGVVLTIGAYLTTGYASVAFIAALGFANAMMWPAIFPLAIRGLGAHTETGSALLIMAISGGALMPYAFGLLKEHVDFQLAYLLLAIPSYLYIFYFGARGWRAK